MCNAQSCDRFRHFSVSGRNLAGLCSRATPGKVRNGFPSGIASKQRDRAVRRFRETLKRSMFAR
ncbi:MAG: hypothetical protein E5X49_07370 [Mesorhizobium sp.]|nr:MAG: hypothetical protein EOQ57_14680 [Mesorhizobium sp.]RWG84845.1 MAG: hypothetical protein EOQ69_09800 [Mesorhizobium sp.]RWG90164.1 MAG: hypothetical protein EOQ70_06140 [Mesorhizobium sp.]RWK05030.1 MAG: hypothetical protein EOR42_14790 [Mesorhizobium sp.]RWK08912.1 MAG: hypothetical protein EOR39_18145 [Mesorhizobium sp.]